jgi:hypothetical protein
VIEIYRSNHVVSFQVFEARSMSRHIAGIVLGTCGCVSDVLDVVDFQIRPASEFVRLGVRIGTQVRYPCMAGKSGALHRTASLC